MEFRGYIPPKTYTPPERTRLDDDRAWRVYCTMHRIGTEFQAAVVGKDGRRLKPHPADCIGDPGEDKPRKRAPEGAILVDANSARLITQIADNLNDANRAKFLALDIGKMGRVAWKLAK